MEQLQDSAGGSAHVFRIDVKEHAARAAVQAVFLKGKGHAVIPVLVGTVVKALEDTADAFMPQLNHIGDRLIGGFFIVQAETVFQVVLKGTV